MSSVRDHLQLVDRRYKAPSAESVPATDLKLFGDYIIYSVADYLAVPDRILYSFDCRQKLGGEPGMCEFEITNQGDAKFPYGNILVRYLLIDGTFPVLAEMRLNRRPGYVLPYFDPNGNRLPVGETYGWVEIRENKGPKLSVATDAQPHSQVRQEMQDAVASDQIYIDHSESGAPNMYAADMSTAVESAVHYWQANGLAEACRAMSHIMWCEGGSTYEQFIATDQ